MNIILYTVLILIAINDVLFYRIEDEFILAILIAFVMFSLLYAGDSASCKPFIYSVVCFISGVFLNACGWIGGGDVKMLSALLLFYEDIADLLFAMSVAGLVLGAIYYCFCKQIYGLRNLVLLSVFSKKECSMLFRLIFPSLLYVTKEEVMQEEHTTRGLTMKIPYGVVISIGNLLAL